MSLIDTEHTDDPNFHFRQQDVIARVLARRDAQDRKWGKQDHNPMEWLTVIGEEYGEACKGSLQARFGSHTTDSYIDELIDVAASAIAAIESHDRQVGYLKGESQP